MNRLLRLTTHCRCHLRTSSVSATSSTFNFATPRVVTSHLIRNLTQYSPSKTSLCLQNRTQQRSSVILRVHYFSWGSPMDETPPPSDLVFQHDPKANKFFMKLSTDDDVEAKIEYVKKGDVYDLWHTEVPPEYRGKGIAGQLTKATFEYCVQHEMKMRLTCPYLIEYMAKNGRPEYVPWLEDKGVFR